MSRALSRYAVLKRETELPAVRQAAADALGPCERSIVALDQSSDVDQHMVWHTGFIPSAFKA
jgi:hypothetical protein